MTDTPPARLEVEVEALVIKALQNRVKDGLTLLRGIINTTYTDGAKNTFRSPLDGQKLGTVYKTDPDPVWTVTDRLSFDAWLATVPAYREETLRVREGDEAEALAVLLEHAPHLLEENVRVREGAEAEALAECKRLRRAIAPGVELVKPEGTVTVLPAKTAGAAIQAMVDAGLITWDGRHRELEAAEEAAS